MALASARVPLMLVTGVAAVLICLPVLTPAQEPGETVDVSGVVGDAQSGRPIPVALVELVDLGRRTATDADGRFVFLDLPSGSHTLRVTALGYATWEEETELGHLDRLRIGLLPQPVVLDNIRVVADRLDLRRKAAAVSVMAVDRPELVRAAEGTVAELVRSRVAFPRSCPDNAGQAGGAGIVSPRGLIGGYRDILELCLWYRGRVVRPNVFIDEQLESSALLWAYAPSELYAVEIYGGGREVRIYTVAFIESGRRLLPRLPGWR